MALTDSKNARTCSLQVKLMNLDVVDVIEIRQFNRCSHDFMTIYHAEVISLKHAT